METQTIICKINQEPIIHVEISDVSAGAFINGNVIAQYLLAEDLTSLVNGTRNIFSTSASHDAC